MDERAGLDYLYKATLTHQYILDGRKPLPCHDPVVWSMWFEASRADRIVAQEHVKGIFVSTVFLALDHNFNPDAPPMLFETMLFSEAEDGADLSFGEAIGTRRYPSWEEAEAGHQEIVALLRSSLPACDRL